MSHKATQWLASLDAQSVNSGMFRVLFHLCDCHNPSDGCFPSQKYLANATGLSNGGLNNALKSLEQTGLISRHRRVDQKTRKQRPTRYLLAFEKGFSLSKPTPESGDGNCRKPTPESGDGSDSTLGPIPSPLSGQSRLHSTGDKPVREPVKNQRARKSEPSLLDDLARFWADKINAGKPISSSAIAIEVARRMLALELCEPDQLRAIGVTF